MIESFRDKKILLVVAHPDDEVLGLGGTMHRLINELNVRTHVVILGEGLTSRSNSRNVKIWEKELKRHKNNIADAQKVIGYHSVSIYDFPDNRFDTVPLLDIVKVIEHEKKIFEPEIIFTHHGGDLNIDHQKTFEAVLTACRPLNTENVKLIITFETLSGTEWTSSMDSCRFSPNFFVSFAIKNLEQKIEAMECYEFEKRTYPHPRSPKSLKIHAASRGTSIGFEFAEAFCIIRSIN